MSERYSIEVDDEVVEIYGYLTIEEAFDFLSFFERKGYKAVIPGNENSTLRMMKSDREEVIHDKFVSDLKEQTIELEEYLKNEKESHEKTKQRLNSVELLLKEFMNESKENFKKSYEENMKLLKIQCVGLMAQNPEFKK